MVQVEVDVEVVFRPTTILVDEAGVIRWIDAATDYRMRSVDARVRVAIEEAFLPTD